MKKILKFVGFAFIALIVLIFIGALFGGNNNSQQTKNTTTQQHETTSKDSPTTTPKGINKDTGVSMSQFNSIHEGMTYDEVVSILGSNGEVVSSSEVGGVKTVMYQWKGNSLGANMNAMFQNDKMVTKAQFGLN